MSPFGSRAASLGTAWIWDPPAFRPRLVRTMPPLPKAGSRLPAVPAAAVEAEARPTARPSTNVLVNAAGIRFFTCLVLPHPPRRQRRPRPESALVTEHDPAPLPVHPGLRLRLLT